MTGAQIGGYAGTELRWFIEHDSMVDPLIEVQDIKWNIDRAGRPGGAVRGRPRNRYH